MVVWNGSACVSGEMAEGVKHLLESQRAIAIIYRGRDLRDPDYPGDLTQVPSRYTGVMFPLLFFCFWISW